MKRTALLFCLTLGLTAAMAKDNDPILMTIGEKAITKSEFEYIWKKNNTNTTFDQQSFDEYVDLFVNFKLKVAEAEAQGLDTTTAFVNELDGYRKQLITPYLTDKETEARLAKKTYDRIREYVESSHILIRVDPNATPEDTLVAWNKITDIYKQTISGKADFADLAKQYSEDGTREQGGYLGFVTGFRFIYAFENAIYGTPVGEISAPVRTDFGYHIVKVHSRRQAPGRYRSAHIMKMASGKDSPEAQETAKKAIFDLYEQLKGGADFAKVAQESSDDQGSSSRGGEYGVLFCGSLPIEYEDAVFKLQVGQYSEPFKSSFGWHIVKALEFLPYPSQEEMMSDINGIISRDERSQEPKYELVAKLKQEYGYSIEQNTLQAFIQAYDQLRLHRDSTAVKRLAQSSATLFTLGDKKVVARAFSSFLAGKPQLANNINKALDAFAQDQVLAYEDSRLETKYPEFGHLMQEYRDGILLFEVSNREVWDKASLDTKGLEAYFKANKKAYDWTAPRFKGFVVHCADKTTADAVKKQLRKLPTDSIAVVLHRTYNTDTTQLVRVERGLYAQGENGTVDSLVFKKTSTKQDARFPFPVLQGKLLKKGPEAYTDVRGLVVSDYQTYLEKQWLSTLRKKYPVSIDKAVAATVNKN
ncbi:MAG: hypothetical protein GXY09_09980 [Bacteroidales bacterium]|nr:hypothetical protein [Bacteroidales bacterium]